MKTFKPMRLFWLIFWITAGVLILSILPGCSPQKRLDSLLKNNPGLISPDTVYVSKTTTLPPLKIDTSFAAPEFDAFGIGLILERYHRSLDSAYYVSSSMQSRRYLDSLSTLKLIKDLRTQINKEPCLKDTLKVLIPGGGYCLVFQGNGKINASVRIPERKHTVTVPYVVNSLDYNITYKWNLFWAGLSLGVIVGLILGILINKNKNK